LTTNFGQLWFIKAELKTDELRERIKAAWEELDQRIIDTAVTQWRTRLHACVKVKGDHFEHKLP